MVSSLMFDKLWKGALKGVQKQEWSARWLQPISSVRQSEVSPFPHRGQGHEDKAFPETGTSHVVQS